jgi:glycerophosphoryl diester phosphodiesterase
MTIIVAHRGCSGEFPENTLPAFEAAVLRKIDGIELDVHLTRDHEIVVIHDENVKRTTDSRGLVRNLSLAEIKKLDAGSWFDSRFKQTRIPTLKEVFELLEKDQFTGLLNIELKTNKYHYPGIEAAVDQLYTSKAYAFKVVYSSFNLNSLLIMHEINPTAKLALLMKAGKKEVAEAREIPFIEGMHPNFNWLKKNLIQADQFPKNIRVWTIDKERDMQFCFEAKIAGIITNYPELAKTIRQQVRNVTL